MAGAQGGWALSVGRAWCAVLLLASLQLRRSGAFNLDVDKPTVFSGPEGSYFGFSVDFFKPKSNQKSDVLVGAPRANTSSSPSSVVERGAVYSCPWRSATGCQQLLFDDTGRTLNASQMDFKSKQWFGASVRSDGEHILACAPLYQWSTFGYSEREPVGTCFLKKGGVVVEYSPCRTSQHLLLSVCLSLSVCLCNNNRVVVGGPGSFYWQGQLISDDVSEIFARQNKKNDFQTPYSNTLTTKAASAQYDDSYLGTHRHTLTHAHNTHIHRKHTFRCMADSSITPRTMAAYFGHSVAATDVNNDGMVDVLVGAPLFMDRGSDGKLREVGQVCVYLGRGGFSFHPPQKLTGSEVYARYGSSIAALGDLDMDGFNDVAISAPYGSPDHRGLVYIHNGRPGGPNPTPSQVLQGKWASAYMPPSFGYSMTGNTDIDQNGYPDLIVGVFGADKAVLYRARPVISVNATLDITPQIINPEDKSCTLPGTSTNVACFKVKYCLKASGKEAPASLSFRIDLVLDRLKHKEANKRVFFLHSQTYQYSKNMTVTNGKTPACEEQDAYLRDDREFRDKITPISVVMEFSLDYQQAADKTGLLPILDMSAPANITKQAHILLDCGDDNICKPDLRLEVKSDREELYFGDDNVLTLQISADNQGEGAYEAELHIYAPPQADYTTVVRRQGLSRLSCAYRKENQTKLVVCDLGNPMKGGTKVLAEVRFSVHQLSEQDTSVKFDLQIVSSNQFNNTSPVVSSITKLAVMAKVDIRGVSAPDQILLPIANWKPKDPPVDGDDIGPTVLHVYELHNGGPSTFSKAVLNVNWPYGLQNGSLLYIIMLDTEGPINCTTDMEINPLNISVSMEGRGRNHVHKRDLEAQNTQENLHILVQCLHCQVGRLERGKNAILFIYSRLAVNSFLKAENQNRSYVVRSSATFSVIEMPYKNLVPELPTNSTSVGVKVQWLADGPQSVPGWVVALAVLAGLLLLALLIFIMYKLGFFKRVRPPQDDCTEKEQLQPEENGNTDA
uniref:Integrin, alpha V n=1 Tax=Myripristis murdjan TaxID=586833 RepID=A0A667X2B2_9TELE